jgi:hypothetical protein
VVGQVLDHDDYVVTVIDLSLKPEERADAPIDYAYHGENALECGECGGTILRAPLTTGQHWPGSAPHTQFRIIADNAVVSVSNHRFNHCLIVETDQTEDDLVSEITYAPGIGPVRMRYRHPGDASGAPFREEDLTDSRITIPPHLPQAVGRG